MKNSKIENILNILANVAEGTLEPNEGLKMWLDIDSETDPLIASIWHDLSHFVADGDIRAKDKEYETYQIDLLKNGATKIREKYSKKEL
ncbi:MAG: hypothetical protein IH886_04390 [Nitrospinae bacterium]|nr:hypothetical protein [Nitrospinota bacterium]